MRRLKKLLRDVHFQTFDWSLGPNPPFSLVDTMMLLLSGTYVALRQDNILSPLSLGSHSITNCQLQARACVGVRECYYDPSLGRIDPSVQINRLILQIGTLITTDYQLKFFNPFKKD